MPRAERPIDAAETELGAFAADLRRLREKAGKPAYRELASRAHYSAAALADAASGRKLPTLAVTLAYVSACGGDAEEWEKRWRLIASPPDATDDAPYVGLTAFQPQDADRFFGRENLTRKLEGLVTAHPFVGVVGPSGSGKSSLLHAGLVPRLGNALVFTPGALPADECAVRLAQLTGESAVTLRAELDQPAALGLLAKQHDVVLVVDQFEEVFTLCDTHQRDWFVTALTSAPRVVVGVRADFYGHVGRHPELAEALDGAQLLVGPMTADELRRAITEPANRVGATVETALLTRLMADVAGQAAALPLVQHALVETWHRRRGMTLTLAGYVEAGGVEHAIARTAETVFSTLSEQQQTTAKQIFLRLVALGEGTEDTKRRANRADLDDGVLERLTAARLVSLNANHVELSHEALIRSWPRLNDWIAEDRDTLRVHHQLTEAAAAWDGDPDLLYKGVRLAQAGGLNSASLTETERAFLTASQADGRRRARRVRVVLSMLSVLVLLLAGTVVFAVAKAQEATQQRNEAFAARAATEVMRLIPTDPLKAARLALAAHAVTPDLVTRDAVLNSDAARLMRQVATSPGMAAATLTTATNGEFLVAVSGSGQAMIVNRQGDLIGETAVMSGRIVQVLLTEDDRRVFTFDESGEVRIWDITELLHPRQLGVIHLPHPPHGLSVSRDGTLATSVVLQDNGTSQAYLWDLRDPARPQETRLPSTNVLAAVAAPSGDEIALLVRNNSLQRVFVDIWDIRNGGRYVRTKWQTLDGARDLAFSSSGRQLAVRMGGDITVWDITNADEPTVWTTVPRVAADNRRFAFSTDDRQLATQNNESVDVWDISAKGQALLTGSFGGFRSAISGLRYRDRENAFSVIDGQPATWSLRTDLEKVHRELCRERTIELSDEEWQRYFPDVKRVPVC